MNDDSNLTLEQLEDKYDTLWEWEGFDSFIKEVDKIIEEKCVGKEVDVKWFYLEPATWDYPEEYVDCDVTVYVDSAYEEDGVFHLNLRNGDDPTDKILEFSCNVPYELMGVSIKQTPEEFLNTLRNFNFKSIEAYIYKNSEGNY